MRTDDTAITWLSATGRALIALPISLWISSLPVLGAEPVEGDRVRSSGECTGVVIADDTEEAIVGAVVTIVELDRVVQTDGEGSFRFTRVPSGEFTLGVHAVSFASSHRTVRFPMLEPLVVRLKPDYHFQEEVTITALPWVVNRLETPQSVDQVDQTRIKREGNNSIGEALEHVPGLANVGTGDGLGTPVIRGMSANRVRVLNDGVPVNHQQWSSRHSPNIEPALAERVEVVRGPASIMWGPDAVGGVVNVVQAPLPSAPVGKHVFHGEIALGYFSNNDQGQGRFVLEGARGGAGWRVGAVRRNADDIETPEGPLDNTDYSQTNGMASVGHTAGWGAARLRWHHWEDDVGFFFPAGSPADGFRLDLEDDTFAADLVLPTGGGDVNVVLSRQENVRKAFNPAAPVYPDAAVNLELDSTTARLGFEHRRLGAWKGKIATEYRGVENTTLASTLLPDYDSDSYSLMAIEEGRFLTVPEGSYERVIANFGLRWDSSDLKVPVDPTQPVVPDGFDEDYSSVTGSLGLVYRATEELSLAANVGRGWRPPNAFELFARGIHGGIAAYQMGNPDLGEETNLSSELSVRYQSGHWQAVITGYRSDFSDYIYVFDTGETDPATALPIFGYDQTDATIDGVEASVRTVPIEQLELGVVYSNIDTKNDTTGSRLPQTPPDRVSFTVRGTTATLGRLASPFAELEAVWVGEGVPSGPDEPYSGTPFGAATDSYNLLHFKIGFQILTKKSVIGVDLNVRNVFDEEYTDFLYPYKGFGAPNPGRDVRLLTRYQF